MLFNVSLIKNYSYFFYFLEIDQIKKYLLVMEYAEDGTLQTYLKKNFKNLTWDDKYKFAYQLACGVSCLHNEGIVHRDLVIYLLYSII